MDPLFIDLLNSKKFKKFKKDLPAGPTNMVGLAFMTSFSIQWAIDAVSGVGTVTLCMALSSLS